MLWSMELNSCLHSGHSGLTWVEDTAAIQVRLKEPAGSPYVPSTIPGGRWSRTRGSICWWTICFHASRDKWHRLDLEKTCRIFQSPAREKSTWKPYWCCRFSGCVILNKGLCYLTFFKDASFTQKKRHWNDSRLRKKESFFFLSLKIAPKSKWIKPQYMYPIHTNVIITGK